MQYPVYRQDAPLIFFSEGTSHGTLPAKVRNSHSVIPIIALKFKNHEFSSTRMILHKIVSIGHTGIDNNMRFETVNGAIGGKNERE